MDSIIRRIFIVLLCLAIGLSTNLTQVEILVMLVMALFYFR
jgi:hypothetical protein